ncbi:MAG: MFS transporter, partial [Burkholderiaceae bacterium]
MKDGPGDSAVAATMRQLAIAAFASGLSMRICDPMLPQLMAQFDGSLAQVSPVVTVFAIAYGVFCLVHGPIGDRLGKLRVVAIAAQVCAVAS